MTTVRVDAYPGALSSVEFRDLADPSVLLDTSATVDITEITDGVYSVETTLTTGEWCLVLYDSTGAGLGVKYASESQLHATDSPPQDIVADILNADNSLYVLPGSVGFSIYTSSLSGPSAAVSIPVPENFKKRRLTFHNGDPRILRIELLDAEEEPVDFTGIDLEFVIEREDGTSVVEVLGLTGAAGYVDVVIPAIAAQDATKHYNWSVRKTTGEIVGYGPAVYQYAAVKA